MPDVSFSSLAVVLAVAFFSRLLLGLVPRFRVPGVVIEIILGIIIGPSVLGWATADEPVSSTSSLYDSGRSWASGDSSALAMNYSAVANHAVDLVVHVYGHVGALV